MRVVYGWLCGGSDIAMKGNFPMDCHIIMSVVVKRDATFMWLV